MEEYSKTPSFEIRDEILELMGKIRRLENLAYKLDYPEMQLRWWQKFLRICLPLLFTGPEEKMHFWFQPR